MMYDNRQFLYRWCLGRSRSKPRNSRSSIPPRKRLPASFPWAAPRTWTARWPRHGAPSRSYSRTTPAQRLALLERVLAAYNAHYDEIARAISTEMGAPIKLAKGSQTRIGVGHISAMIEVLKTFKFEETARHHAAGAGAGRRVRADHAVELADEPGRRQSRSGARSRLHHGPQALRVFAVQRHSMGQGDA